MADEKVRVVTEFTTEDRASGPLAQIAKGADALSHAAKKAKDSVKEVGAPPAAPAEHAAGGHGGGHGGLTSEEKALYKAEREEAIARRLRARHIKLEDATSQAVHRGLSSLALLIGEGENKSIGKLLKASAASEMIGTSLFQMGGKIGKLGGALETLGSWGAVAAAALEVGASAAEAMGVDLDKLSLEAKKFTFGLSAQEQRQFDAMEAVARAGMDLEGEERKAAVAVAMHMRQERDLAQWMRDFDQTVDVAKLKAAVGEDAEKLDSAILLLAGRLNKEKGIGIEEATKKAREAIEGSIETVKARNEREARAAQEADNLARIHALQVPEAARTVDEQVRAKNAIAEVADAWSKQTSAHISFERAQELLNASAERSFSAQEDKIRREQGAEMELEAAAKLAAKSIKMRVPGERASAFAIAAYNEALIAAAKSRLPGLSDALQRDPEALGKLVDRTRDAKVQMTMDFRGSRFDIKQQFAEGFDPDRVATAFANDLGTVGERRLQSGFAPLFSVR